MTDLERPGSSSRYTWGDGDDTEAPAEGVADSPTPEPGPAPILGEHELRLEVAALEAEEDEALGRGPAAAVVPALPAGARRWDDSEVTDVVAGDDRDVGDFDDDDDVEAVVAADDGDAVADDGADDGDAAAWAAHAEEERALTVAERAAAADGGRRPGPAEIAPRPSRSYSDVVYVFEPNTKVLPPLREYLGELWARRRFMVEMARAESRGSRSSTVLGELWAVIDPLFQVALYWFLLSIIRQGKGAQNGDLSQNLVLMVGGIFLFTLSSTTITAGGRSILSAKNLMLNSTFPRALLPLSAAYKAVVEFIPTIFIYLLFHIAFGQSFGLGFFVLPLLFVIQMTLSIGLGLVFATFTVFLRDTTNILGYIMRVLFFATPVIYPASAIPDSLRLVLQLNPLLALFTAYQAIILGGTPNPVDVVISAAWATIFIVVGYRLFVSNERSFALRL